ncbi:uncharacterized protein LOC131840658 [Achroia grisella]|uniref:uncharacterized protein LOC131840658 n=1 Tax=Achroia grisella TaxID=688607 RepID=UPI0027D2A819|nr:uncharacterized protein LOC131840658 [Achroia grisella]
MKMVTQVFCPPNQSPLPLPVPHSLRMSISTHGISRLSSHKQNAINCGQNCGDSDCSDSGSCGSVVQQGLVESSERTKRTILCIWTEKTKDRLAFAGFLHTYGPKPSKCRVCVCVCARVCMRDCVCYYYYYALFFFFESSLFSFLLKT